MKAIILIGLVLIAIIIPLIIVLIIRFKKPKTLIYPEEFPDQNLQPFKRDECNSYDTIKPTRKTHNQEDRERTNTSSEEIRTIISD
jgi:hypothetical protein